MRKILFVFSLILATLATHSQTNLDSLLEVWNDNAQPDTIRLEAVRNIVENLYHYNQPDSAFYFSQMQYELAESKDLKKWMANARINQGRSFEKRNNIAKALYYYEKGLKIYEEIGYKSKAARIMINNGRIYNSQDNYIKALEYYQRGLKHFELLEDKMGIAHTIASIGLIYHNLGDYAKALDYYHKSFELKQEVNDKPAMLYVNMGSVHTKQGNYPEALDYFQKAINYFEANGEYNYLSRAYVGIAELYKEQGDYTKALIFYQKSLEFFEEIGNKILIAGILSEVGNIYLKQRDHQNAIKECQKGLQLSQDAGSVQVQKIACTCLYNAHKAIGNGNKALEYHEQMLHLDSVLQADETSKKLQHMEFQTEMLEDSIAKAEETRLVQEAHQEEVRQGEKTRNIALGGGLMLLILAGGLYGRVRYIRKSKAVLQTEKDRSENLLLNILPADIAAELKEKGKADARDFDLVSILFTDFKGFTKASEKLSAQELVSEINICFEAFDGIMAKYGIEKIKTIGDAYMAAGGLPVPSDESVKNTVLAALEMQAFISDRKAQLDSEGKPAFEMRVGVHTGPVVAGIVGVKKFQYDIWGDTVNTASRMESSGEVGLVNISKATYELLKDETNFKFESRGKIEAKGKGEMEMYFVTMK